MYAPPPRIDPRQLRPKRRWFLIAALIAVVFILIGAGGFAWGLVTAVGEGKIGERFGPGESVTVHMDADPGGAIYVRDDAYSGPDPTCTVTSATSGRAARVSSSGGFSITVNGVTWNQVYSVDVPAAGDYKVACRPEPGQGGSGQRVYAAGEDPELGRFFGGLFGGLASLFVIPLIGVIIATIIAIVVGVKRGSHRRRLLAQMYGPPRPPGH